MKKVKHWIHVLLIIFTCGLWLPGYVIILATTEMFNRGYRVGKRAGRIELAADPEWMRVSDFVKSGTYKVQEGQDHVQVRSFVGGGGGSVRGFSPQVVYPENVAAHEKSKINEFAELSRIVNDRPLTVVEHDRWCELRAELLK